MDTISALRPEKPPLGAWYLVTPGGLSAVKITDGLTFTEEETHQSRQLALAPPCTEGGLISFRVDTSGIWLSVCHDQWQISGAEGVVVRPFPIFRPVDVFFRDSVVHLRPDFSNVECDQAIELSLEPVPEVAQPLLSLTSIRQLQNQLNESQQTAAAAVGANPSADPLAVISPLPEPGFRKIGGTGRPSAVRLIPDPAPQGEIPLLTDAVDPDDCLPGSVSVVSDPWESEPAPVEEDVVAGPHQPPGAEVDPMATKASSDQRPPDQYDRARVGRTVPKHRFFLRVVVFAISVFMVSTDLPGFLTPAGITGAGNSTDSNAVHPRPQDPTPATSGVLQIEPVGRSETSRQLMAAVQALLESKSPADPVTRQFVEDAIRVVNEGEAVPDDLPQPASPGSAGSVSEPTPVMQPEGANSRI